MDAHNFFLGWTKRLGNPPYLFYVPLERESTRTSRSNHHKITREQWRMPKAYALINTEIGSEFSVLEELKKVESVEEAHNLWGVYGIIATIKRTPSTN
jgi:hypothetical protein